MVASNERRYREKLELRVGLLICFCSGLDSLAKGVLLPRFASPPGVGRANTGRRVRGGGVDAGAAGALPDKMQCMFLPRHRTQPDRLLRAGWPGRLPLPPAGFGIGNEVKLQTTAFRLLRSASPRFGLS
jgi:hypothetical protein